MTQLDLLAALSARDEALDRVENNGRPWIGDALLAVANLRDWRGTSEELRLLLLDKGLRHPHHHNGWGALTMSALRKQLLVPTGERRNMATKRSHARNTPVYRRAP